MEFRKQRELKRTKIEIIPMIDTIFFLLVFFMLSSLALTKLNSFPVDLPKAATATRQSPNDLTITVDKDQKLFVNKQAVTLADLGAVLLQKAGPSADLDTTSVVINADLTVPHGLVVSCMDEARKVGVSRFAIATAPEDESGK
ncbi:MAG: ExbD/TolR family protein [Capsulimonadaceae bacterium]